MPSEVDGGDSDFFLLSDHPDFRAIQANLDSISSLLQRTKKALNSRKGTEDVALELPDSRSLQVKARSCDAAMVKLRDLDEAFRTLLIEAAVTEGFRRRSHSKTQVRKLVTNVASSGAGASLLSKIEEKKSTLTRDADSLRVALDRLCEEVVPELRRSLNEMREEFVVLEGKSVV